MEAVSKFGVSFRVFESQGVWFWSLIWRLQLNRLKFRDLIGDSRFWCSGSGLEALGVGVSATKHELDLDSFPKWLSIPRIQCFVRMGQWVSKRDRHVNSFSCMLHTSNSKKKRLKKTSKASTSPVANK